MTADIRSYGRRTKRGTLAIIGAALLASAGGCGVYKEGRAWLYGLEGYVYGFPLIMMDLTKEAATAVPTAGDFTAPVNQFAVMTHYPDASFRAVVRTGLDTLFATAWADLDKEPLVLSVPDTNGRYYVIALFDMWSNVFASIGKRTTGTGAGNFLIAGPGWQGKPPADIRQTFRSPTRLVWVNGQMQANGAQDYAVVNALQKQYKLTPLAFEKLQEGVKKLKTVNGWIVMPKDMGNYGTEYNTRAGIALVGLGAIQTVDIGYPTAFDDGDGKPLDGANRYVLHFDKDQTPPTNVTWSVSMYDPQGFYVPNAINRYNLAAWMPLQYNPDGSLDVYIQVNSPGADKEANWLPAPASGTFNLVVRNFWPKESMLDGSYKVPPVRKVP
jgi:hypothetical protein